MVPDLGISAKSSRRYVVVLAGILMLFGTFARVSLIGRDAYGLTRPPMTDDAYYDQSYARAIAGGQFFSINGADRGNAYHPLYNFLIAPIYRATRTTLTALRLVLAVHLVLYGICLFLACRVSRMVLRRLEIPGGDELAFLAGGLYAIHPVAYAVDMNLMQTGLQLVLIWAVILQTLPIKSRSRWVDWLPLGFTFALACLARIDSVVFLAGYGVTLLAQRRLPRAHSLALFLPSGMAVAVWLWIGHSQTGFWLPTGGSAQWSPFSWSNVGYASQAVSTLMHMLLGLPKDSHYTTPFWSPWWMTHSLLRNALVSAGVAGFAWGLWAVGRRDRDVQRRLGGIIGDLMPVFCGLALIVLSYLPTLSVTYFFMRYFAIWVPVMVLGWTVLLSRACADGRTWLAGCALVVAICLFGNLLYRTALADSWWWPSLSLVQDVGEDTWVAAFESGVLGFYHRQTVNLDGKTNADALRARRSGTMDEYIVRRNPEWIVDRYGITTAERYGNVAGSLLFLDHYEKVRDTYPMLWRRRQ